MTRSLLTTLMLFGVLQLFAQQKVQEVKLRDAIPLKEKDFYCYKVVDARINKDNIGYVLSKATKKRKTAQLKDFVPSLEHAFNCLIPKGEEKKPLVVVIHNFSIAENLTFKGKTPEGAVFVLAEFAKEKDGQLYTLGVYEANILVKELINFNNSIYRALSQCIELFDLDKLQKKEDIRFIEGKPFVYNYMEIPSRGLYRSFGQMARGEAISNTSFMLKHENVSEDHPHYRIYSQNKLVKEEVSYISDGKFLYIEVKPHAFGAYFIKAKFLGKYIFFENDSFKAWGQRDPYGISSGTVMLSSKNNVVLDTTTGRLYVIDKYTIHQLIGKYPDLMKTFRQSKKKWVDIEAALRELNKKFEGKNL